MARRRASTDRRLRPAAPPRVEAGVDGHPYEVRPIVGSRAVKTYRCPGCDQEIRPGTPHLVAWPVELGAAVLEDRRHWHTSCWRNRATRGPTRKWS